MMTMPGSSAHHQVRHVQSHHARLKVKDLHGEGVALLRTAAERKDFFLDGRGGFGEFVVGIFQ